MVEGEEEGGRGALLCDLRGRCRVYATQRGLPLPGWESQWSISCQAIAIRLHLRQVRPHLFSPTPHGSHDSVVRYLVTTIYRAAHSLAISPINSFAKRRYRSPGLYLYLAW